MRTNMQELRIVDNFYQTSSYFPMPTLLIARWRRTVRRRTARIRCVFRFMWRERNITR